MDFAAKMHQAVQAAVRYPPAAKMMGMQGRARVSFTYVNGQVSDVRLVTSSGSDVLDRAALEAVRRANYPMPPDALKGKVERMTIWVRFALENTD